MFARVVGNRAALGQSLRLQRVKQALRGRGLDLKGGGKLGLACARIAPCSTWSAPASTTTILGPVTRPICPTGIEIATPKKNPVGIGRDSRLAILPSLGALAAKQVSPTPMAMAGQATGPA